MMRISKYFLFIVCIALILPSCNKDDQNHPEPVKIINKAPQDFKISPEVITSASIEVSFTESLDDGNERTKYRFYINDVLIADNQSYSGVAKFENLKSETTYSITLVAFDTGGKTNEQHINLKTRVNGASIIHTKFNFEGKPREYGLYLPTASQYQKLPLFIFLHGAAGVIWPEMIDHYLCKLAQQEHFINLQPQALVSSAAGSSMTAWDAHNTLPWNDVSFINCIIDSLDKKGLIDLNRIYVSGMSNGGFMTYTVAEELQDRIAAIAPIAGLMDNTVYAGYDMRKQMPLCHMHGTADQTVPIEGDEYSVGWSTILSLWMDNNIVSHDPSVTQLPDINTTDNSTVTKFEYNSYSGKGDIVFYQINNGVHSIPGNEYPSNRDINAFDEIWKFFKEQTLQPDGVQ